jgi:superkiller protein 3
VEYRQAIKLKPDFFVAHHNLGAAFAVQGKLDKAIAAYRKTIELKPDHADAHNNLGNALWAQGKLDQSIAECRKAIDLKPNTAVFHYSLGDAYLQQGRLDLAMQAYRKYIELSPSRADAHNSVGVALFKQGKLEQAIAAYRRAIALNPYMGAGHYNLFIVFLKQGKVKEAIAALGKVVELEPNHALGHNQLAWLLANHFEAKFRNPKRAVELAKKAVALDPKVGDYWSTLGSAHYRTGNWKEAIVALQKSMELHRGGDSFECFFLAMAQWQLGNLTESRAWYRRAVEWTDKHQPNNEELRRLRAEAADLFQRNEKKD